MNLTPSANVKLVNYLVIYNTNNLHIKRAISFVSLFISRELNSAILHGQCFQNYFSNSLKYKKA